MHVINGPGGIVSGTNFNDKWNRFFVQREDLWLPFLSTVIQLNNPRCNKLSYCVQ
jgi:hypothetical protein